MRRWKPVLGLLLAATCVSLFFLPSDRGATLQTPATPPRLSGHGRVGVYLTAFGILREDILRGVLEARRVGKIDTLVINIKDNHGDLSYASNVPLAKALGAATGLLDFAKLIPILRGQGFYLIARQVVFNDPILARHLGYSNGWIPAADPTAIAYNLAIAQEVAALGFDELQFDYIRYADGGGLASGYEARYAAINAFLNEVEARIGSKIALS
ncbi:MAG: putative glycoside hydrolase, partial [Candidatus Bipolaricaulis sp.]|nr:putative glycoside hydrolase [Candidatus Bipolaricaulis sp.]